MSAGGMQSILLWLLTSVFALGSPKVAVGFFGFFVSVFKINFIFGCAGSLLLFTSFLWLHRATSFSEQAFALVSVSRLLVAVVSLVMEHGPGGSGVAASRLWSTSSTRVAHGLSFSKACGIFPDRGSNPCLLHWQAGSLPLCHRGSPLKPVNAHSYSL